MQRVPCDLQPKSDLTGDFPDDIDLIPCRTRHAGIARQAVAVAGTDVGMMLFNMGLGLLLGAARFRGAGLLAGLFYLGLAGKRRCSRIWFPGAVPCFVQA